MFKKILVANRGAIAVRIIRTCRDLGIDTVAIYSPTDRDSLHVRQADECLPLTSDLSYGDRLEVLALAKQIGADAIHPGYGFLAEDAEFAQMCADAGIQFIGPSVDVLEVLHNKIETLSRVQQAGFQVPAHSDRSFNASEIDLLAQAAQEIGFPVVVKSCVGGRGRGGRVAMNAEHLRAMVEQAQAEAIATFGDSRMYLERSIAPSHYLSVQILADTQGNIVHLGEHDGSLLRHNQKLLVEAPAPSLSAELREQICQAAVEIARLFHYQSMGGVEFLVDASGNFYFTEIKARIQMEHAVHEMVTGIDLVAEQIYVAAGQPLRFSQAEVKRSGHAILCRINAEDPWRNYLPSPGLLERYRLPSGMQVRVDTYGYAGCQIPVRYDSLLANIVAKADTRAECIVRLRRALEDCKIVGVQTNLPLFLHVLNNADFVAGEYDTSFMWRHRMGISSSDEETRRDLAVASAVAYLLRSEIAQSRLPERFQSGWHRSSRHIPG